MDCDHQRLVGYLYGELEDGERREFDAHLAACPACRQELEKLAGTARLLRTWPDEDARLNLVFVREEAAPGRLAPHSWRRLAFGLGAFLAAVVLMLALADFEFSYGSGRIDLKFALWSEPEARTPSDPLDRPATRRDLLAAQEQSLELIQDVLLETEAQRQREFDLTLTQFARQLERQRYQDLQQVGQRLQDTADRFRRNEEILQYLVPAAWYPERDY